MQVPKVPRYYNNIFYGTFLTIKPITINYDK